MSQKSRALRAVVSAAALTIFAHSISAADLWWEGDRSPNWNSFESISGTIVDTNFSTDDTGLFDANKLPTSGDIVRFSTGTATNLSTNLGTNTFVDGVVLQGGPGNVSISGNTLTLAVDGLVNSTNRTLTVNSNLATFGGAHFITTNNAGGTIVVNSAITTQSVNKFGPGTLLLNGNNSYPGSLTVGGGLLRLGNTNALAPGRNINLQTGTIDLSGFNPTIGDLTIGGSAASGVRTITNSGAPASVTLNGNFDYKNPGDPAHILVPVILSAGNHIVSNSGFSNTFYDIVFDRAISGAGGLEKTGTAFVVLNAQNSYNGATVLSNGNTYAATTNALSPTSALTVNSPAQLFLNVTISSSLVTPGNYNQSTPSLAGSGNVILGSSLLTLTGNQSTTFSGIISGTAGKLTKVGTGTLTLTGNNTYTGLSTVQAGTLSIGNGGIAGNLNGPVQLNAGARLVLFRSTTYTFPGLISGSGDILVRGTIATLTANQSIPHRAASLEIVSGGLNLSNNDLLIDYTGTSPIATLINYFLANQLQANDNLGGLPTTIAISEAADLGLTDYAGQPIDDTTVILKYTYVGDANLDGQVDALDYERVDLAIGNSGVLGTAKGDLNYDGNVDALDYEQIDLNIGNGVGTPLSQIFIPEPTSLAPAAFAALLMARRRRALTSA